jgi:hypothetical protein
MSVVEQARLCNLLADHMKKSQPNTSDSLLPPSKLPMDLTKEEGNSRNGKRAFPEMDLSEWGITLRLRLEVDIEALESELALTRSNTGCLDVARFWNWNREPIPGGIRLTCPPLLPKPSPAPPYCDAFASSTSSLPPGAHPLISGVGLPLRRSPPSPTALQQPLSTPRATSDGHPSSSVYGPHTAPPSSSRPAAVCAPFSLLSPYRADPSSPRLASGIPLIPSSGDVWATHILIRSRTAAGCGGCTKQQVMRWLEGPTPPAASLIPTTGGRRPPSPFFR